MNKIIWTNSPMSGLCDRLMDLMLMSTLAKINNSNLYLRWVEGDEIPFTDSQRETWPAYRFSDYLLENVQRYFIFPKNIEFVNDLTNHHGYYFNDYVGGMHSPNSFCRKYSIDEKAFMPAYRNIISEFKPTERLKTIIKEHTNSSDIPQIDLSIHLRRTDKVNSAPNAVEIATTKLDCLDAITEEFLRGQIEDNAKRLSVFVCSDSIESKKQFEAKFESECDFINYSALEHNYESTYVDLLLLSESEQIVMSQKHSNFSLFASMINQKKLIYFYENNDLLSQASLSHANLYKNENYQL